MTWADQSSGGLHDSAPLSQVRVSGGDIQTLDERTFPDLLRRLLHAEARAFGVPEDGIHVASNIHAPDGGEDGRISWQRGPERTAFLPSRLIQFQLKTGRLSPRSASKEVLDASGMVKPMLGEVLEAGGNYILLCAHSFTRQQIRQRKDGILQAIRGAGQAVDDDRVDFRDGVQIAEWVNSHSEVARWCKLRVIGADPSTFALLAAFRRGVIASDRGLADEKPDLSSEPVSIQPGPVLSEDHLAGLPPNCRERIKELDVWYPWLARQLVNLLADPSSRTAGVLSRLATDPPRWLDEAPGVAWEVIGDFMNAHNITGADVMWPRAVSAGSPRTPLYLIRLATRSADNGDGQQAESLLSQVPSDYPLLPAAQRYIRDDPSKVVDAVPPSLLTSDDSDLAHRALAMLIWAFLKLEEFALLARVLRDANQRYPGRAWLLFQQANATVGMVDQRGLETPGSRELLIEAVGLALQSRDCFRVWDGPSHIPVSLATRALLVLDEPQRVVDVAAAEPEGNATASEAIDPEVRRNLAQAYLMLGRLDDIDSSLIEGIPSPERAWIQAMRALTGGEDTAPALMRTALAQADDANSRQRALFGLAMAGEVDETALAEVSESHAALCRGVAAIVHREVETAITTLSPHGIESNTHAYYLAQAQGLAGRLEEAIKTLTDAAEHLGDISLYEHAAELLVEVGRFDEARSMAARVLSRTSSVAARHRLQGLLVKIAHLTQDWQGMESHAQTLSAEFPQDEWAAWMVVYALHRQGQNQQAWDRIVGQDMTPYNKETAQLAITACRGANSPNEAGDRLLGIADKHRDSEDVFASAVTTLMTVGDRIRLTEEQKTGVNELVNDFVARYPQSEMLQVYAAEEPEELWEKMSAPLRPLRELFEPLIKHVSDGSLPYGMLRRVRELPYAELLVSFAAGYLTAIPRDENRRKSERQAAKRALGGTVVVDTSVAIVGLAGGLDLRRMGRVFESVLVADELIADARMAVSSTRELPPAVATYDPGLGRPVITEISVEQRRASVKEAQFVLKKLEQWQRVSSGHLPAAEGPEREEDFRPWDASIRLAASRDGCALWCDDLGLRTLAELEGIPTFGTWALYQVLSATSDYPWLPTATETQMQLLRKRVADVPISLSDLGRAADESSEPEVAVELYLRRPHSWREDPNQTLAWYSLRAKAMAEGPHHERIPLLLYQACIGWGSAVSDAAQKGVINELLAKTLLAVRNLDIHPTLAASSKYAERELASTPKSDPLLDVVGNIAEAVKNIRGGRPLPGSGTVIEGEVTPTAFISYSWDSDEHKSWVRKLAESLRRSGVDAQLDQWEVAPGDRLPQFMEKGVRENKFVLIICTPEYRHRSDERKGGVGYEGAIITAELMTQGNERKFIPVLRTGTQEEAIPTFLQGKLYIDLSGDPYSETEYSKLVNALIGNWPQAPPLGSR